MLLVVARSIVEAYLVQRQRLHSILLRVLKVHVAHHGRVLDAAYNRAVDTDLLLFEIVHLTAGYLINVCVCSIVTVLLDVAELELFSVLIVRHGYSLGGLSALYTSRRLMITLLWY